MPSSKGSPNPGIKTRSPTLQVDSLLSEPQGKPKNTGVGGLSLLQGIFLTQESNQSLLYCRWILYQLSYQGNRYMLQHEINLENINEKSQTQKDHKLWFHLYEMSRTGKSTEVESILVDAKVWGEWDVTLWGMKIFWDQTLVMVIQLYEYVKTTELHTLKWYISDMWIISQF